MANAASKLSMPPASVCMFSSVVFRAYGERGAKRDSKEEVVATGGIVWSRDMGRWSEKKDDILTSMKTESVKVLQHKQLVNTYQAAVENPWAGREGGSKPGPEVRLSSSQLSQSLF